MEQETIEVMFGFQAECFYLPTHWINIVNVIHEGRILFQMTFQSNKSLRNMRIIHEIMVRYLFQ